MRKSISHEEKDIELELNDFIAESVNIMRSQNMKPKGNLFKTKRWKKENKEWYITILVKMLIEALRMR